MSAEQASSSGPSLRGVAPVLGWAVICGLLVFLVVDRRTEPSAGAAPVEGAEARWSSIEQRLAALEGRLGGLEVARRTAPAEAVQPTQAPAPTPLEPATPDPELSRPWTSLDEPGSISGKPEAGAPAPAPALETPETSFPERMKEILARVEDNPILAERAAERSAARAGASDDVADPAAPSPELTAEKAALDEAQRRNGEALIALNRLLVDTGLQRYHAITVEVPEDEVGAGLRAVSLVERGESGETTGSLHAGRIRLRYFEPRRARFLLEECHGMRGEVRVEFPQRVLEIEIPGLLDPGLVDASIAPYLWEPETRLAERAVSAAHSAVIAFNDVLTTIENVGLRFRSIERLQHATLTGVVIDLEFDSKGKPVRTVRANTAWLELHEASACVQLHCEGGDLSVDGKTRPLFRGRFSHTIGNVQPTVWSRLAGVRVVAKDEGAEPAGQ